MKQGTIIVLMLVCIFPIHGCSVGTGAPGDSQQPSPDMHAKKGSSSTDTFEIRGTITYVNLEGGFFAIHGDDGSKYNPIHLPEAFRKDGLKIKALVRPRPDAISVHMFGSIIEIIDIWAP